jgi:hypothetical protein
LVLTDGEMLLVGRNNLQGLCHGCFIGVAHGEPVKVEVVPTRLRTKLGGLRTVARRGMLRAVLSKPHHRLALHLHDRCTASLRSAATLTAPKPWT